jgi:hypothetical protein
MRALLVLPLMLAPALAGAQQAPGPPLPVAMDLGKAPLGAWADYTINIARMPPLRQHFALVGRDAETHAVEMTSQGGAMGPVKVVIRALLEADPKKKERIRQLLMQIGDNEPMELPRAASQAGQFAPIDRKKLVGTKKIAVPAGSFSTRLYRQKSPVGAMEIWASDQAPPFGIVKLKGSIGAGADVGEGQPMTMELTAQGTDAKPVVTRAPRPYDQETMMKQMRQAMAPQKGAK